MKKTDNTTESVTNKHIHLLQSKYKKLEKENEDLKKSVTSFSCVFDQSPVGSAIIGLNRQFLRCNLAFCRFLGYSEDELTGKTISFVTYPEDVELGMNDLEQGKIKSLKIQKRFLRKDSRVVWGELNLCLVYDSMNTPIYFLPVIQDIDKNKQAEKKLIESEERYRRITKGLTDYMYTVIIKNGKAIKTLHNEACISITGYSPKEFNKDPYLWINIIVSEDREMVSERFQNLLEGDDVAPLEHRIICKNGKTRWISDTAIPRYDSTGLIVSYDGVIKDITKRKLSERYGEIGREILNVLNDREDINDSIQPILNVLKTRTGFDAAGIRLQQGDDYPYIGHLGFSNDFILTENTILNRDTKGELCRNSEGKLSLECTCGQVISGKTNPDNPFFTKGGSFWTNDEANQPFKDTRLNPRNKCFNLGYQSIALIPIKNKDIIIGLIQLNDKTKGCFTPETIEILEGIASHIGAALMRKQAEAKLIEIESLYKNLITGIQKPETTIK